MAELIIYAGRFGAEFLNRAHEQQCHSGASQPASDVQKGLKRAAASLGTASQDPATILDPFRVIFADLGPDRLSAT